MKKLTILLAVIIVCVIIFLAIFRKSNFIIYPIWLNNIAESISMKNITINLSTDYVSQGKFIPTPEGEQRHIATIKLPRAYINWKPYLKSEAIGSIEINSALPDLIPYSIFERNQLDVISKNGNSNFQEQKNEIFRSWVKIGFGVYGFSNQLCKSQCTRAEHNSKVLQYNLQQYPIHVPQGITPELSKYVSESQSGAVRGRELYVLLKSEAEHYYIECDAPLGLYHWCSAHTILNDDMYLDYQFEYVHLKNWKEIDSKVRSLVNGMVISNKTEI